MYFIVKKYFQPAMIRPLVILFFLGALQGAIGWIMVASGLVGDAVYVKPTRLALHFIFALGLLCYTFWFALKLIVPEQQIIFNAKLRKTNLWLIGVLIVQLLYGALMAGHKAATAAPSWPMINTEWIPAALFKDSPWLINFIENKITIHFVHRGLAYLLTALIIVWYYKAANVKGSDLFQVTRFLPLFLVILQVVLGIASVLTSPQIIPNRWGLFEWMAQLHQLVGMFLLLSFIWILYLVRRKQVA